MCARYYNFANDEGTSNGKAEAAHQEIGQKLPTSYQDGQEGDRNVSSPPAALDFNLLLQKYTIRYLKETSFICQITQCI